MKKFFKYLGIGFLGISGTFVLIAVIMVAGTLFFGIDKEEVFVPYIESTVPQLMTWDVNKYEVHMSKKGFETSTREQWILFLKSSSRLGTLQSIGDIEFMNSKSMYRLTSGLTTYATYRVPITMDTGLAHVILNLQHNDEKVEINGFKFLSDLLFQ